MPDKRRHRGKHPDDERLFAEAYHNTLRTAVAEYSWLLTRHYAVDSALKLVGDRHGLTARQRMAVRRSACCDESLRRRATTMVALSQAAGRPVAIDGYNLLITVESALSGGLILTGRDGCYRDLASVHGTYRKVKETLPAIELILDYLAELNISHVDWYLDRPVSNSGRLKALIADVVEDRMDRPGGGTPWNIELVDSPDAVLADSAEIIVSSDSDVLDQCGAWLNLAAELIDARVRSVQPAWVVDLRPDTGASTAGTS